MKNIKLLVNRITASTGRISNSSMNFFNFFLVKIVWKLFFEHLSCSVINITLGSDSKASVYNAGDLGSIPGSVRYSGEGNGNPLQYSCLENPMDGGAWIPWVCKESDTTEQLHFHFQAKITRRTLSSQNLCKEMHILNNYFTYNETEGKFYPWWKTVGIHRPTDIMWKCLC